MKQCNNVTADDGRINTEIKKCSKLIRRYSRFFLLLLLSPHFFSPFVITSVINSAFILPSRFFFLTLPYTIGQVY